MRAKRSSKTSEEPFPNASERGMKIVYQNKGAGGRFEDVKIFGSSKHRPEEIQGPTLRISPQGRTLYFCVRPCISLLLFCGNLFFGYFLLLGKRHFFDRLLWRNIHTCPPRFTLRR